jgi:hypothetical protein
VHGARRQRRLLAHDALAGDLEVLAHVVVDEPATPQELHETVADVLDAHGVREDVAAGRRQRLVGEVARPDRDAHAAGLAIEEGAGGHVGQSTSGAPMGHSPAPPPASGR